ncbi:HpcH/HpaI aldolase family protein [Methylophaga sp. OBS4]|uniref:HpcH/HpaI aldolase family protein n=1 Tax=Methylophaga sp. OBS4 TaxID=2991935 RepID=UPI00225341ED|nr:aldolase/citrate lyase family protein [Methylophaga sp. OBS4]MCX4187005.1 aldolase/citrate lyase family protein [Methylophaga sp. OBS4]
MLRPLPINAALSASEPVYGLLNSVPHPVIVEMIATAGYDFVILDLEHLPHDEPLLKQCIQLAMANHCAALIRLASVDLKQIGRVLDMGAAGIVVPQAENVDQLVEISKAMFFPPRGKRGITGGSVTGFGKLPLADYISLANQQLLLVPMIESAAGVAAIDEILKVDGVSMVMEGALDLALNMGLGPEPMHADVQLALCQLAQRCQQHGMPFCANPRSAEQLSLWREAGVTTFLCGEDRGFLYRTLAGRLHEMHPTVA